MYTFTELQTRVQSLTGDTSAATATIIGQVINEAYSELFLLGSFYSQAEEQTLTTANQDTYTLPTDLERIKTVQLIRTSSGTADGTSANKLVDSTASFSSSLLGKRIGNSTDDTFATITAVDSATQLTVSSDIFVSGEGYAIADGETYLGMNEANDSRWENLKSPQINHTSDNLEFYNTDGANVQLYPTPSTDNYMLVVTYMKEAATLSGSIEPELPEQFKDALVYKPCSVVYRRREQLDMSREYERDWEAVKKKVAQFGGSRTEGLGVKMGMNKTYNDTYRNKPIYKA